jgi:hypothetical protein
MARVTPKSRSAARPVKDEWGVYDPQVAGMAALLARLDKDHVKVVPGASAQPALRTDVPEPKPAPLPLQRLRNTK